MWGLGKPSCAAHQPGDLGEYLNLSELPLLFCTVGIMTALLQRVAVNIRQGDAAKEGGTRARWLLLVVRVGTLSGSVWPTVCTLDSSGIAGAASGEARCQLYKIPASCKWFHLCEPQVTHVYVYKTDSPASKAMGQNSMKKQM